MFYVFLPSETTRRSPPSVMIYTYRTKISKTKKKKTATVLAPAGVYFNEIQ